MTQEEDISQNTNTGADEQEKVYVGSYIIPLLVPPEYPTHDGIKKQNEQQSSTVHVQDSSADTSSTATDTEPLDDEESGQKAPFWLVVLFILAAIGEIILFIPLCILALMGIYRHPFVGYIVFRDLMRNK